MILSVGVILNFESKLIECFVDSGFVASTVAARTEGSGFDSFCGQFVKSLPITNEKKCSNFADKRLRYECNGEPKRTVHLDLYLLCFRAFILDLYPQIFDVMRVYKSKVTEEDRQVLKSHYKFFSLHDSSY